MSDFVIRPFAFMRLTHDALRAGFSSMQAAAASGDLDATSSAYAALQAVIELHKRHEEEVFFPLLDELFDGAVRNADLREAHVREEGFETALERSLGAGDLAGVRSVLDEWAPSFEEHLTEEERVMMPLTEQVAPTLEGRAAEVGKILAVDWQTLADVQLPYVVRSLDQTKPYGPLRMFVAAVQIAAGEHYSQLEPAIRNAVSAEKAAMLVEHGHLS